MWRVTLGRLEVLLVHRPHRGDWSLPKGKRNRRESSLDCALREVHEETGFRCAVGRELPEARYVDRKGRPKRVRYWAMHDHTGEFQANDEVDAILWMDIDRAVELVTHDHDMVVIDGLRAVHATIG